MPSWRARAAIVTDDSLLVARTDGGLYRERLNADGTVDALGKPPVAVLSAGASKTVYGAVRAGAHIYALVDRDVVHVPLTSQHATGAAEATGRAVSRSGPALAVVGSYLYALGGRDANGPTTTVERAEIFGDGTLGAFADAGVALAASARAAPRARHQGHALRLHRQQ